MNSTSYMDCDDGSSIVPALTCGKMHGVSFHITGDPQADQALDDPFGLLLGMLLDQHML